MKRPSLFLVFIISLAICACENQMMASILRSKTITFESNGGSPVPSQTVYKNWKISEPQAPSRAGFSFNGWFTDNAFFYNKWDFNDIPEGDMTLYAEWLLHETSTPTKDDFIINGAGEVYYDGNPKKVTVTAKPGKTGGNITVYYEGTEGTNYPQTTDAPSYPGTYRVTFDAAAHGGWDAAYKLEAGMLIIKIPSVENADELKNYLNRLSSSITPGDMGGSPANPIIIPMNISDNNGLTGITAALNSALNVFVKLDLSGSAITTIPDMAFTVYTGNSSEPDNNRENYTECKTLTGIILQEGVTSIGFAAFANCIILNDIAIPNGIENIGMGAFAWCESLTIINLPDSVTSIGTAAFFYCRRLTSVNIPNGINNIEESVFEGCYSLTDIIIPENVTGIGNHVFYGCTKLTKVKFEGTINQYDSFTGTGFHPNAFGSSNDQTGYIGDLYYKYFEVNADGTISGAGTYTRPSDGTSWEKQ